MEEGNTNSIKYHSYLQANSLSSQQIQTIEIEEDNIVWKCLLGVSKTNKMTNHEDSIKSMKIIANRLDSIYRNTTDEQSIAIYVRTKITIMSNLLSRSIISKKYDDATELMQILKKNIKEIRDLRQALMILFGIDSLVALKNYDIFTNIQFKYDAHTQAGFLILLGQVKYYLNNSTQAKLTMQKFKLNRDVSAQKPGMFVLIAAYILNELDPLKNKQYYESAQEQVPELAKDLPKYIQIRKKLIILLYQIEKRFLDSKQQILTEIKIHDMYFLKVYMANLFTIKPQFKKRKQYATLSQQINNNNSLFILRELEKTKIFKESVDFCEKKIFHLAHVIKITLLKIFFAKKSIKKQGNSSIIKIQSSVLSKKSKKMPFPKWDDLKAAKSTHKKFDKKPYLKLYANLHTKSVKPFDLSRIQSIINDLKKGGYVNKLNFNSKGITKKYLAFTEKQLRWSAEQQDINDDYSKVKFKNVLGIVYGKVSENFAKRHPNSFPWHCFSLITEDRSYDFDEENESKVYFWLQGLSYHLQKFHENHSSYPFYSKGRALWKKMFLKIRYFYPQTANHGQKKYKNELAGAIVNFNKKTLSEK